LHRPCETEKERDKGKRKEGEMRKEGEGRRGKEGVQARGTPGTEVVSLQSSIRSSSTTGESIAVLGPLLGGVAMTEPSRFFSGASFVRAGSFGISISISSGHRGDDWGAAHPLSCCRHNRYSLTNVCFDWLRAWTSCRVNDMPSV